MADELTITIHWCYTKDGTVVKEEFDNIQRDVTGTLLTNTRQEIGSVEEPLDLSGVNTGGYLLIINHDATDTVSIRSGAGATDLIRLEAGDIGTIRLDEASAAPYAIATGLGNLTPEIEFWLLSA